MRCITAVHPAPQTYGWARGLSMFEAASRTLDRVAGLCNASAEIVALPRVDILPSVSFLLLHASAGSAPAAGS